MATITENEACEIMEEMFNAAILDNDGARDTLRRLHDETKDLVQGETFRQRFFTYASTHLRACWQKFSNEQCADDLELCIELTDSVNQFEIEWQD